MRKRQGLKRGDSVEKRKEETRLKTGLRPWEKHKTVDVVETRNTLGEVHVIFAEIRGSESAGGN